MKIIACGKIQIISCSFLTLKTRAPKCWLGDGGGGVVPLSSTQEFLEFLKFNNEFGNVKDNNFAIKTGTIVT